MLYRFYTDTATVDYETLEEALQDYEAQVGMLAFGELFNSLQPEDIQTAEQAAALCRLLPYGTTVHFQRLDHARPEQSRT